MQVTHCKHCYAPLPTDALTREDDIIVCEFCSTVHHMQPVTDPDAPKYKPKKKREKPDKFDLNRLSTGVEISYPWFGKQHRGLLFFAVIWNTFIFFFTVVFIGGMLSEGDFEFVVLLFLLPFYLVGIGMAYYVVAGMMNRTSIMIAETGITTEYGPIRMIGTSDKSVKRDDIHQVYCRRRVAYESNDVPVHVYDVHYVKSSGDDVALIKGMDSLGKAVFIEQTIEQLYKIKDRPAEGEYGRHFG